MPVWLRRTLVILVALAAVVALALAFVPEPVPVDVHVIGSGSMQVAVEEDGQTRIKERYVVSAPLAGRLRRQVLDAGDEVVAGETVIATIEPTDPALLDARARAEAEARVSAADAAVLQSAANLERARSTLDFAEDEITRTREAHARGGISALELATKEMLYRRAVEEFRAAEFGRQIARFELEQARSALVHTVTTEGEGDAPVPQFQIRSPITGRVLRLVQESDSVVGPGAPLLELGDPTDLEIVVDVLSTDAVRIRPGDRMIVEHWGGDTPLEARVRLIEPSAFTKVSALGVEEQRVNVIADFVSPLEHRRALGDAYRVEVRIVIWEAEQVTIVPTSALFPHQEGWAVFVLAGRRASLRPVEIGRRNGLSAEVLGGLVAGDQVIAHPSDRVHDRVRVDPRS